MPLYDYRCRACGQVFEAFVFPAGAGSPCPRCGNDLTDRLLSAPAIKTRQPGEGFKDGSGGVDQFTADVHGYHSVKELPPPMRANYKDED